MSYTILKTYDQSKRNEFTNIVNICSEQDNINYSFFMEEDVSFLGGLPVAYYATLPDCDDIVGFISVYCIDEDTIEICAFVLPKYRRNGIFSMLVESIIDDCEDININIPVSNDNAVFEQIAKKMDIDYMDTEIKMSFNFSNADVIESVFSFDSNRFSYNAIVCDDATELSFYENNEKKGSVTLSIFDSYAVISDVLIKKEYRGMGLGTPLIKCILNYLSKQNISKVILHVSKSNIPAYKLYIANSFTIEASVNYYSM